MKLLSNFCSDTFHQRGDDTSILRTERSDVTKRSEEIFTKEYPCMEFYLYCCCLFVFVVAI